MSCETRVTMYTCRKVGERKQLNQPRSKPGLGNLDMIVGVLEIDVRDQVQIWHADKCPIFWLWIFLLASAASLWWFSLGIFRVLGFLDFWTFVWSFWVKLLFDKLFLALNFFLDFPLFSFGLGFFLGFLWHWTFFGRWLLLGFVFGIGILLGLFVCFKLFFGLSVCFLDFSLTFCLALDFSLDF